MTAGIGASVPDPRLPPVYHVAKLKARRSRVRVYRSALTLNWDSCPIPMLRSKYGGAVYDEPSQFVVDNASDWPDDLLYVVCDWLIRREGVSWGYAFCFDLRKPGSSWYGWGQALYQRSYIGPYRERKSASFRSDWTDRRYVNPDYHRVGSPLLALVFLIAHETCHARSGHPACFYTEWKTGGRKGQSYLRASKMERHCNRVAMAAVNAFKREYWAVMRRLMAIRRSRRHIENRVAAKAR